MFACLLAATVAGLQRTQSPPFYRRRHKHRRADWVQCAGTRISGPEPRTEARAARRLGCLCTLSHAFFWSYSGWDPGCWDFVRWIVHMVAFLGLRLELAELCIRWLRRGKMVCVEGLIV